MALFVSNGYSVKEDIDERFERCYAFVQDLIRGASEAETHDTLVATVSKSNQDHETVCLGLLASMLVDSANAHKYYRDLTYVTRDGLGLIVTFINHIVLERYSKLQDVCRAQLIWVVRELIRNSIANTETTVINLLRQIAGGDVSAKNIWLAEKMIDLLQDNRSWVDKHSLLIAISVYTYLRLIVDHGNINLSNIRQKEIVLCISLLREKFADCIAIGRDLVRLLQNVARIPEFDKFWRDLYSNPTSLAPNFQGVIQLMQTRTSRRFLQCRLTPDMEKKILYLTSSVKFGQQKRYQDWFQRQYLSTPESQSLRCDLIRYICGVIHPSNEVLCSEIIPRWAIIGWILSSCTSNTAASLAKLSLFYDWLFYDPEKDNIMNIEPAILVMFHSMRNHSIITVGLLDFLCRIMIQFFPPLAAKIKQGITASLHQILEKRVLGSLSSLFESPKLDIELRLLIRESFPDFCLSSPEPVVNSIPQPIEHAPVRNDNSTETSKKANHDNEAKFSDDDDIPEFPPSPTDDHSSNHDPVHNPSHKQSPFLDKASQRCQRSTFDSALEQLGDKLKPLVISLEEAKDNETRCEYMEKILQIVLQDEEMEELSPLSECLLYALRGEIFSKIFPSTIDEESLEESIGTPLFVIFRNLCQTPDENPNQVPILSLLVEMYSNEPCIGYLMLYYIKVSRSQDSRISHYREFSKALGKEFRSCLLSDLKNCQEDDPNLFCFLIPDIFSNFPMHALNNPDLLHLIVSCVDSNQLNELTCLVLQGNLTMFRKDGLISLLNSSLEWETFEQFCFWHLLSAHNISIEHFLSILPKLEFQKHAEALSCIMIALKREKPNNDLLKHITGRDVRENDSFTVSILKYWILNEYGEKLADLLAAQLTKSNVTKRKRTNSKAPLPSGVEQILVYLDQLRQTNSVGKFFTHEVLQKALLSVQESCNDSQKSRFSDLFALIEDHESNKPKRGRTNTKKAKQKPTEESNSDTEASEEEVVPVKAKPPTPRKKRKTVVPSDSE
ncbi:integrator complex subunit 3 [Brevipalpus obovatus]|uniref:integrator complex subunit 3 n=1 Tax=Brevipalpus obovatus TaxID=246614 RepID=UPI003D9E2E02